MNERHYCFIHDETCFEMYPEEWVCLSCYEQDQAAHDAVVERLHDTTGCPNMPLDI